MTAAKTTGTAPNSTLATKNGVIAPGTPTTQHVTENAEAIHPAITAVVVQRMSRQ